MAEGSGFLERQNICTYVEGNLDTFEERPLCAVDSLVLSWYSNFRLEALGGLVEGWGDPAHVRAVAAVSSAASAAGTATAAAADAVTSAAASVMGAEAAADVPPAAPTATIKPVRRMRRRPTQVGVRLQETLRAEAFDELFDTWDPASCKRLLQAMAASPRFRDVRVAGFVLDTDASDALHPKQFCAVTLGLTDELTYVAFRGTDASVAGWREDFDMSFTCPVPAQTEAAAYLADVASRVRGNLVLGGHSKGGNLAVYAAAMAAPKTQARIERVFSHDGPGFSAEFLASKGFARIQGRVEKTLPQSSIVGMLMESHEDYSVVKSTSVGIFQHDPFSWVVEGQAFVEVEGLSAGARHMDATISQWLSQTEPEERERFVDAMYGLLDGCDVTRMADIVANWQTSLPAIAHQFGEMDEDTRSLLFDVLGKLAKAAVTF